MKVLRAKEYAKMKKNLPESADMLETDMETHNSSCETEARSLGLERPTQDGRELKFISMSMTSIIFCGAFLLMLLSNRGLGLSVYWWALAAFQWGELVSDDLVVGKIDVAMKKPSFVQEEKLDEMLEKQGAIVFIVNLFSVHYDFAARLGLNCTTIGHVGDEIYGNFLLDVLVALRDADAECDVVDVKMQGVLHLQIATEEECASLLQRFSMGIVNITSTYNSRRHGLKSSLVARGDLWRVEASHGNSTSGNGDSSVFLLQLGPVLFVHDSTLLLPIHLSKHLLKSCCKVQSRCWFIK